MTVAVITDGAAALPAELAAANRVTVVPLQVAVAGQPAEPDRALLAHLDQDAHTAAPPPGRLLAAIRGRQEGDGVLVCTVARSISSVYQAASLAARQAPGPVQVLDTGIAAAAQGLVVLAAARAAAEGRPPAAVAAAARRAADRVQLVAAVERLDRLVASGRVPRGVGRAGDLLGLRPLFAFRAGTIRPLAPARSPEAARRRILGRWRASREAGARLHVAAIHALAPAEAAWLLDAVRAEVSPATAFVAELDAAIMVHTGPGVAGLAWWWEPARP